MQPLNPCRVPGCSNPVKVLSKSLCGKHYQREMKYGDPETTVRSAYGGSFEDRVAHHGYRLTDEGCWEWGGGRFDSGYGQVRIYGKTRRAHRLAYETWVGPIPEDMVVRHKCDNPPCINPEHLELGTPLDNTRDMVKRNRRRGNRRLSEEDVRTLRSLYSSGTPLSKLADLYPQVTRGHLRDIINGRSWSHL